MNPRIPIATLALTIGGIVSWVLVQTNEEDLVEETGKTSAYKNIPSANSNPISDRKRIAKSNRHQSFDPNAIPYERLIAFSNEKDYHDFLSRLGKSNLRNLGQIDALRSVRLGFDNLSDFDALEIDPEDLQFNFPVTIPELDQVPLQTGIVGFGSSALSFLGITGDNSNWGEGVKIAVIDTGIVEHIALSNDITHINLVELAEGAEPNSHGTSVASLIAGNHPNLTGVAPAAELISVRVADETGFSTSFLLAEGIIAASDAGANIINISLGSESDSPLVRQAVEYATERGTVIFASSGNSGSENAAFPAGDDNVFAVGAVDALGQHLNFSSSDSDLAFTAPGLDVNAAFPGDLVTSFTGTSGAVAFPVGAVAAIMSESETRLTASLAVDILNSHTNEAGTPGADSDFGIGIIDIGRALNRDVSGIEDLAVASQTYLFPNEENPSAGLQVSIENRGTEPLFQSSIQIGIAGDFYPLNIQSIEPNERQVITIPAGLGLLREEGQLTVISQVTLANGVSDDNSSNDRREEVITLPEE